MYIRWAKRVQTSCASFTVAPFQELNNASTSPGQTCTIQRWNLLWCSDVRQFFCSVSVDGWPSLKKCTNWIRTMGESFSSVQNQRKSNVISSSGTCRFAIFPSCVCCNDTQLNLSPDPSTWKERINLSPLRLHNLAWAQMANPMGEYVSQKSATVCLPV